MGTLKDKLIDRFSELMKVYKLKNGDYVIYEMEQKKLPNAEGIARIHHLIPDCPGLVNDRLKYAVVTYKNQESGKDIAKRLKKIILNRVKFEDLFY